jgi:hypothetical protein
MDEKIEEKQIDSTQIDSTQIDGNLLKSLELIQNGFNLRSMNEVIATLLTIADVLINNPEIADLVLLKAKEVDGVLSDEEIIAFAESMGQKKQGENLAQETVGDETEIKEPSIDENLMDENDKNIIDVIEHFIPGAKDYIPDILTKIQNKEIAGDLPSFMDELQEIMGKARTQVEQDVDSNANTNLDASLDVKEDGLAEEGNDENKELAKIKVISLNSNKNTAKNNKAPMGKENWLKYAMENI